MEIPTISKQLLSKTSATLLLLFGAVTLARTTHGESAEAIERKISGVESAKTEEAALGPLPSNIDREFESPLGSFEEAQKKAREVCREISDLKSLQRFYYGLLYYEPDIESRQKTFPNSLIKMGYRHRNYSIHCEEVVPRAEYAVIEGKKRMHEESPGWSLFLGFMTVGTSLLKDLSMPSEGEWAAAVHVRTECKPRPDADRRLLEKFFACQSHDRRAESLRDNISHSIKWDGSQAALESAIAKQKSHEETRPDYCPSVKKEIEQKKFKATLFESPNEKTCVDVTPAPTSREGEPSPELNPDSSTKTS